MTSLWRRRRALFLYTIVSLWFFLMTLMYWEMDRSNSLFYSEDHDVQRISMEEAQVDDPLGLNNKIMFSEDTSDLFFEIATEKHQQDEARIRSSSYEKLSTDTLHTEISKTHANAHSIAKHTILPNLKELHDEPTRTLLPAFANDAPRDVAQMSSDRKSISRRTHNRSLTSQPILPLDQLHHVKNAQRSSSLNLTTFSSGLPSGNKTKEILLYGRASWSYFQTAEERRTHMKRCEYQDCIISRSNDALSTAHAVVFRHQDAPMVLKLNRTKKPDQIWILYVLESPVHTNLAPLSGYFNWLMSYKFSSEVLTAYGHYATLNIEDERPEITKNWAANKTRFALWLVSNCGKYRDRYIRQLLNYIPINIGGNCAKKYSKIAPSDANAICRMRATQTCEQYIKSHKFYMAFENSLCQDYVTEKYWVQAIEREIIPVVYGANYDSNIVIPGSYIDASNFTSIKALADYLMYLDKNDTAYNEYFAWKQNYKSVGHEKICRLCKALHTGTPVGVYKPIWSRDDCNKYNWKLERAKLQVQEDQEAQLLKSTATNGSTTLSPTPQL